MEALYLQEPILAEADARSAVAQLAEDAEFTYFQLGSVLSLIRANGWFQPYANFREFVEGEYGINYRKAMYLISIYNNIIEAQVPCGKVKHLGWTKLKEIASILTNENLEHWVGLAEKHTALQLADLVAQAKRLDRHALLTSREAAAMLGADVRVVRQLAREERLPSINVGSYEHPQYRFNSRDIRVAKDAFDKGKQT